MILGPVGENFAAGMTGGKAIVLDLSHTLSQLTNMESIEIIDMSENECEQEEQLLHSLLSEHIHNTGSPWAQKIAANFAHYLDAFMLVVPKTVDITAAVSDATLPKPAAEVISLRRSK